MSLGFLGFHVSLSVSPKVAWQSCTCGPCGFRRGVTVLRDGIICFLWAYFKAPMSWFPSLCSIYSQLLFLLLSFWHWFLIQTFLLLERMLGSANVLTQTADSNINPAMISPPFHSQTNSSGLHRLRTGGLFQPLDKKIQLHSLSILIFPDGVKALKNPG